MKSSINATKQTVSLTKPMSLAANARLDTKQAAAYIGYKNPQTLVNQRAKRVGPNYIIVVQSQG